MPSSISSSDFRPVWVFFAVLAALLIAWEAAIRDRHNPGFEVPAGQSLPLTPPGTREWVVFGNCLVMNGVSPEVMERVWRGGGAQGALPAVLNISRHEFSPLAYFSYLKSGDRYPAVVMANVSSWLNGSNYEIEAEQLALDDPLRLRNGARAAAGGDAPPKSRMARVAAAVEARLNGALGAWLKQSDKRYHLFDYVIFLKHLVTSGNLTQSLYQLGLQPWFKVERMETDGRGYVGWRVNYTADWEHNQDTMADKQILRIRAGNFLNDRYWTRLEAYIREFQARGTKVVLMRMPEHPSIRAVNDEQYRLPGRLAGLAQRNGVDVVDLDGLLPARIRLFDSVHPDHDASVAISGALARWVLDYRREWLAEAAGRK